MKTPSFAHRLALLPCTLVLAAALAPFARAQLSYPAPSLITTLAGTLQQGDLDGTGSAGRFRSNRGIAVDAAGNVYVADNGNSTIRKITFYGAITTLAGLPQTLGSADGTGSAARFRQPRGLALDAAGNLYVADSGNNSIRKITPAGAVTTFAGSPTGAGGNADGAGTAARFLFPAALAIDGAGNLYVADNNNLRIRKITPAGVVTSVLGSNGLVVNVGNCLGVAVDGAGNIYASDQGLSNAIRKITPAGVVTILAGGVEGSADGVGGAARFRYPSGIAADASGNVYVCDPGNVLVRRIAPDGTVTTLAGRQSQGGGIDGLGDAARFQDPQAIAVDARGNLYIADTSLVRMSVFAPDITPQPAGKIVIPGENYTLASGASSNVPTTFQWRKDGVAIPGATTATLTLSASNLPTWSSSLPLANIQPSNLGSYTLVATNLAGTTISSPAVIQFTPPPTFAAQPASQTVAPSANVTLTATATSTVPITYQWQKDGQNIAGATTSSLVLSNIQAANLGYYTLIATNAIGSTNSSAALINYTPSTVGRLINLSVLTGISTATDDFTLGYVVGGDGTAGSKPLVIRAAGPSLGALGVGGTLADPTLELFAGATRNGGNDNWGGGAEVTAAMAAVGAFPYSAPTSRDAAVAASITTRDNSVKVSGVAGATGTVIAEVYDATPAPLFSVASPRLLNVSVLKQLGSGLTAGFVVGGTTPVRVLIRVVGPGLAAFGVGGTVVDPQLALFRGSSQIGANNDWANAADVSTAGGSVGAFNLPANSRDAALVVSLDPGNYSVLATGVNNTAGLALVEIYEAP
jgi:sugar lactone lactonase YvrE